MLAPPAFPEWLPPAVKEEAERILRTIGSGAYSPYYTADIDAALVFSLATDKRMQTVWQELSKHKPSLPHLREGWTTLMKGRLAIEPPSDSDASALFFWVAYTLFGAEVGTVSWQSFPIASYRAEAARLRLSAAKLRELNAQHNEVIQGAGQFTDIHASEVEKAAAFCDEIVETFLKLEAFDSPSLVKRNYGNQLARGYVRTLAVETQSLFGKRLYRTLATVASVALNKKISAVQVRKWCASL
jgi:hypothetical protein